jgi:hypothetical protein
VSDSEEWAKEVYESALCIANIPKQREAADSNFEKFFPAPIELYLMLVEDSRFDEFLDEVIRPVDQATYDVGMRLSLMLDAFPDEKFDDPNIANNNEWQSIASLAGTFAEMLGARFPGTVNKGS